MPKKTDQEWQRELEATVYTVTRCGGTEPAFTGQYWDHKIPGTYLCVCCKTPLFGADSKYDSGSGWPSYYDALSEDRITIRLDRSHGMVREEVVCATCDAHLGHRFPDGPPPTGQRYCINSAALDFKAAG